LARAAPSWLCAWRPAAANAPALLHHRAALRCTALLAMAPRRRTTPRRDASLPPDAETAITPACPTGQLQASPPPQAATHPASLTTAATTGSPLHNGFHPIAPQLTSPRNTWPRRPNRR
jgi:hypothetical protein